MRHANLAIGVLTMLGGALSLCADSPGTLDQGFGVSRYGYTTLKQFCVGASAVATTPAAGIVLLSQQMRAGVVSTVASAAGSDGIVNTTQVLATVGSVADVPSYATVDLKSDGQYQWAVSCGIDDNNRCGILLTRFDTSLQSQISIRDTDWGDGVSVVPLSVACQVLVGSQPGGLVVVAGQYTQPDGSSQPIVVRYRVRDAQIERDSSFGSGGSVLLNPVAGENAWAGAVTTSPSPADGRIYVAGYTVASSSADLWVMRLNVNGSVDTTFGLNGTGVFVYHAAAPISVIEKTRQIGLAVCSGVFLGSENILFAGTTLLDGYPAALLGRLTKNGVLDLTFGTGGVTVTQVPNTGAVATHLAVNSGLIAATGYAGAYGFIASYFADGTPDTNFGKQAPNMLQSTRAATGQVRRKCLGYNTFGLKKSGDTCFGCVMPAMGALNWLVGADFTKTVDGNESPALLCIIAETSESAPIFRPAKRKIGCLGYRKGVVDIAARMSMALTDKYWDIKKPRAAGIRC